MLQSGLYSFSLPSGFLLAPFGLEYCAVCNPIVAVKDFSICWYPCFTPCEAHRAINPVHEDFAGVFSLELQGAFLELMAVEKNDIGLFRVITVYILLDELLFERFQELVAATPRVVGKFPDNVDGWKAH